MGKCCGKVFSLQAFTGWFKQRKTLGAILISLLSLSLSQSAGAQFRPDRPNFFERGRQQLELDIERLQKPSASIPILDFKVESPQWSAVLLQNGTSAVWMPQGIISNETQTVESSDGQIDFRIIASTSALGRFVVAFSGKEDAFAKADPNLLLNRVRTRIIGDQKAFGAVGDRNLTVNNLPGREFTLKNAEEVITYRVLLAQDRLYVLAVSQSSDSKQQGAIKTFFDSFRQL